MYGPPIGPPDPQQPTMPQPPTRPPSPGPRPPRAPYPGPPPGPGRRRNGRTPQGRPRWGLFGAIIGGTLLALVVLGGVLSATEDQAPAAAGSPGETAPSVPAYEVTGSEERGPATYITVEVGTLPPDGGLKQIFDDVRAKNDGDGGYFVEINCSTGATSAADNRLANGRYAVGQEGAAATGLPDGKAEFEALRNLECPAS